MIKSLTIGTQRKINCRDKEQVMRRWSSVIVEDNIRNNPKKIIPIYSARAIREGHIKEEHKKNR